MVEVPQLRSPRLLRGGHITHPPTDPNNKGCPTTTSPTHPPNPTITSHTTCWNFSLEQFFKTWDFCLFPDISNSLTLPYSDRGPEVGWEENGGGQTSSPGEVLHTVGKHKQETRSLSGVCKLQNRSTRVSDIWCEGNWSFFIFGTFWDWKKGITFWVILTNGLEQTPILGPGYPIFF